MKGQYLQGGTTPSPILKCSTLNLHISKSTFTSGSYPATDHWEYRKGVGHNDSDQY